MQGDMFEFGRTYLEARTIEVIEVPYRTANERSLYNIS